MQAVKYEFIDYDPVLHRSLDNWRSDAISRFAMDDAISEEWQYYLDADEYHAGVDAFCKAVHLSGQPVAVMIVLCNPDYPVNINPLVVAPELAGQGHGSAILREFAEHIDNILPSHSGRIEVVIDNENIAAIKAAEKAGFVFAREHPDGDMAEYKLMLHKP